MSENDMTLPISRGIVGDFKSGTLISSRYRIESLIGKGGMGAIYRATDELLGIPVALKFLLSQNEEHIGQLLNEVRLARSITHSTICRVYDIGSMDSTYYFTMELIEGEDLASLLRRIGRLSTDKVLEISQQLCEGLAAAHSIGILHRDLKPANIMIDRDGKIKITDFGLAASMDWLTHDEGPVGTLLYMAPEQFSGGELCERSDVYALGMVLYELVTGKSPFESREILKLYKEKQEKQIVPPRQIVPEVPEALQNVILKSLNPDPNQRPSGAIEVATLLPGIDPLQVARQAGVTPHPEIVARGEDLAWNTTAVRWILILLLPLFLAGILMISDRATGIGQLSLLKAPEIFADRCEQILGQIGYVGSVNGKDYGFMPNAYPQSPEDSVLFWYIQHRTADRPASMSQYRRVALDATEDSGESSRLLMFLNVSRHLVLLNIEAPSILDQPSEVAVNWDDLFTLSGIKPGTVRDSGSIPSPLFASRQYAWEAEDTETPGRRLHIEAAESRNRPIFYSVTPIDDPIVLRDKPPAWVSDATNLMSFPIIALLVGWTIILGIRNYREGRSDNTGGKRLFVALFGMTLVAWLLSLGHTVHPFESNNDGGIILLVGWPVLVWLCYMALEPYARRHCAPTLIAWTRFLRGRFWDGSVGFSILAGTSFGALGALIGKLDRLIPIWMGSTDALPVADISILNSCITTRLLTSTFLFLIPSATTTSISALFILVLLYAKVRSKTIARVTFVLFYSMYWGLEGSQFPLSILSTGLFLGTLTLFVVFHFGLLTTIVGTFIGQILWIYPITLNTQSWFAEIGFMTIGFVFIVGITGFFIAGYSRHSDIPTATADTRTNSIV